MSDGLRLIGEPRPGRAGQWWRATFDGQPAGALRLAAPDPADRDRFVAALTRLVETEPAGVLPVLLVAPEGANLWVVTARPADPTVAAVVSRPVPARGLIAIAADLAAGVGHLHTAGLTHGAVGLDVAAVGSDGVTMLAEAALVTGTAAADVAALADAVDALARFGDEPTATVLRRAAAAIRAHGPSAAAADLTAAGAGDPDARAALAAAATPPAPPAATAPEPAPVPAAGRASVPVAGRASMAPTSGVPAPVTAAPIPIRIDEALVMTRTGRAESARAAVAPAPPGIRPGPPPAGPVHIGNGIPPQIIAAWRGRRAPVPADRSRRTVMVLFLALLVAVAALGAVGGYAWVRGHPTLRVTGVTVQVTGHRSDGCATTVNLAGTIATNGVSGTIRYQWIRSDGVAGPAGTVQLTPGFETVTVDLPWAVDGTQPAESTATLNILAPNAATASGSFTYSCSG